MKTVNLLDEDVDGSIQANNPSENKHVICTVEEYWRLGYRCDKLQERLAESIAN